MIKESIYLDEANPFARKIEFIDNENVLGYLDFSLIYDRIEIDNLEVLENHRNKKIGTKLMTYLIYNDY